MLEGFPRHHISTTKAPRFLAKFKSSHASHFSDSPIGFASFPCRQRRLISLQQMKTLALCRISPHPPMADSKTPSSDAGSEDFVDASDDLQLSDLDTVSDSGSSVNPPHIVRVDSVDSGDIDSVRSPPNTLRRRSSIRVARKKISIVDANDSSVDDSPALSEVIQVSEPVIPPERGNKVAPSSFEDQENNERPDAPPSKSTMEQNSPKRVENHFERETSPDVDAPLEGVDDSSSNFLMSMAGFVITAIGFQISLLVSFFTFPFWLLQMCFLLLTDPFQLIRRVKDSLSEKLSGVRGFLFGRVNSLISKQLKSPHLVTKYLAKFGCGFFWSLYVFFVLVGILVTAFVVGGITARYIVEEPIRIEENLNFDYSKANPVACVPVVSCNGLCGGLERKEMVGVGNYVGKHVIPRNHKLQVILLLTLPESDYNRNLGIFQVRVDFLSMTGKVTSTSRHPCMLRFKSMPIRLLETFIKSGPLLAGYSSESQLLNIKMAGFSEGTEATSCLRVILEQRAEFKPGAGMPEIYAATLVLESELPLLKRIIWNWKKTIFIWISMGFFIMELFFMLVCCRPVIMPKARSGARAGETQR